MLKVLIIGGTGNISSSVSRLALEKGYSLTILNRGNRETIDGAEHIYADAKDPSSLEFAISGRQWDVVADFIAFNVDDAERDIAAFSGKTGQFIFVSSASCYSKRNPITSPITESMMLSNPYSPYATNKIAAERAFMNAYDDAGFPITIVRPSHTYRTRLIVPIGDGGEYTIIDRMKKNLPIVSPGDGTSLWTVTHSDDFAKGFVGLMGLGKAIGEAYHITSDETLTWDSIYMEMGKAIGIEPKIIHAPSDIIAREDPGAIANLRGDKMWSAVFDNSKIKSAVPDYRAAIPFSIGIRKTISWFEEKEERRIISEKTNSVIDGVVKRMERAWE